MKRYFISGYNYIQDIVLEAGTYTFWAYIKSDFGNTFTFALANEANEWEVFDVDVQQGQWTKAYEVFTIKERKIKLSLIYRYFDSEHPVYVLKPQLIKGNIPSDAGSSPFDIDKVTDDLHDAIGGIEDFTNEEFADRVLSSGERVSLRRDLEAVEVIFQSLKGSYEKLLINPFVNVLVLADLTAKYNAVSSAKDQLFTTINTIIDGDNIVTPEEIAAKDLALSSLNSAIYDYNTAEKEVANALGEDYTQKIGAIRDFTDTEFADRMLSETERASLRHDLDNVQTLLDEITARYDEIVLNPYLTVADITLLTDKYNALLDAWDAADDPMLPDGLKTVILDIINGDEVITQEEIDEKDLALANFNNKLGEYSTAEVQMSKFAIDFVSRQAEDALSAATTAQSTANSLKDFTDTSFRDGIIDCSESVAIEKYKNSLNEAMAKAEASYNKVYANTYLEGAAKTALLNAKINLWGQRDTLLTAINTAIAGGTTTPAQKTAVDNAFTSFNSLMSAFQSALEEANKAIQAKLDSLSTEKVNNLEIGGRNLLLNTKNERSGTYNILPSYRLTEKPIVGESYTLSGWFKFPEGKLKRIMACNSGGWVSLFSWTNNAWPYDEWFYFSKTFTWRNESGDHTANDTYVNIYGGESDGLLSYAKLIKLEKGNKATDWTPAPEDVQAAIDEAVVKATYWSVKASAPVIYKDAINAATSGTHTPVTVSGELRSGTTTTQGGFITVTPNGGTEAGTATASPVTIAPANGDGKTSYTVRLYDTAAKTTLLDTMTIPVVFKGASGVNAINVVLSNEADVLPASPEGIVSDYSGSGTTIRVFEGATELDYDGIGTANGKFNVTASATGITAGAKSESGLTCVFANASNMTSDNATIVFTITGKTTDGASFSLTKTQSFAKSRTGQKGDTGASAPLLYLSASAQVMKCNPDNTPQTGQTISIEAKLQNVSGTVTFVATPYNDAGTAQTVITLGGTGNTRTLTNAQWLTAYKRIEIVATLGSLTDKVTIYRVADGATGKGISGTEIKYQVGTSGTTAPTGTWLTSVPTVPEGQFLWTRTITSYTDSTSTTSYSVSKQGVSGSDGKGISSTVITYQASSSGTVVPTGTWSGTIPSVSENQYLWTRTVITYTDNSTSTSYSVGKMGAKGDAGQNAIVGLLTNESVTLQANSAGVVSSFTPANGEFWVYNGVTKVTSGITFSKVSETGCTAAITSAGAYSVSAMSADNATVVLRAVYSGVTIDKVLTISKSRAGADGVSITGVDVEFAKNTSATTPPTTGWATTAPTLLEGEQLWTRTKTTYSSGSTTYTTPANITPKKGDVGTGIESVTEEYAISTSKTVQPTSGWSITQPTWVQGQYIWSRVKVVYKNPASTVYTGYAVSSEWEAVNDLQMGGRNLLLNSYFDLYSASYGINESNRFMSEPYIEGEVYTITLWGNLGADRTYFGIFNHFSTVQICTLQSKGNGVYQRTFTAGANLNGINEFRILQFPSNGTSVSYIEKVQIEKGNKATDWTPAPEDVQAEIDNAKQEALTAASNAQSTADSLKNFTDTAFRDGIIDRSESVAIEKYKNSLNEAMSKAEASYNKVYANTYLEGAAKTALLNAKINLWGQRDTLLTAINTAIAGGTTTPAQKTAVDNAFTSFNSLMSAFQSALEEANKAIQNKLKSFSDEAKGAAGAAAATADDALAKANASKAITDKFGTTTDGGLINTVITEFREADSEQVTGLISGIQGADKDLPFLVAGGTYAEGIAGTAKAIIRHDGSVKFTDGEFSGTIDAVSGELGNLTLKQDGYINLPPAFLFDQVGRIDTNGIRLVSDGYYSQKIEWLVGDIYNIAKIQPDTNARLKIESDYGVIIESDGDINIESDGDINIGTTNYDYTKNIRIGNHTKTIDFDNSILDNVNIKKLKLNYESKFLSYSGYIEVISLTPICILTPGVSGIKIFKITSYGGKEPSIGEIKILINDGNTEMYLDPTHANSNIRTHASKGDDFDLKPHSATFLIFYNGYWYVQTDAGQ